MWEGEKREEGEYMRSFRCGFKLELKNKNFDIFILIS